MPCACAMRRRPAAQAASEHSPATLLRSVPFLLIGVFVVGMMGITAAIPPHLISCCAKAGCARPG